MTKTPKAHFAKSDSQKRITIDVKSHIAYVKYEKSLLTIAIKRKTYTKTNRFIAGRAGCFSFQTEGFLKN